MASVAEPITLLQTMNFPGPIGTKRRRMRSGGNVSTMTNNSGSKMKNDDPDDDDEDKVAQTSKCKGATTIPIFLKKTYKMVDTCDPSIASWTADGEMFVVKDPDLFASQVIPQYFDHNKFSSFARQLNFYGFRKMQSKPIRNSDFDAGTAKHVTFYNENFKRGRCDLLKKIQRSTRGGGTGGGQDSQKEVQSLQNQVLNLEQKLEEVTAKFEERVRRLELDMLARMEQMMMAMQQQQQTQFQLQSATSVGSNSNSSGHQSAQAVVPPAAAVGSSFGFDVNNGNNFARGNSINSALTSGHNSVANGMTFPQPMAPVRENKVSNGPTLPPHPKQKQMAPLSNIPGVMPAPPDRLNSLRGISALSRGISGLTRGASIESTTSAVLLRNSWEDNFFSMLMLGEKEQQQLQQQQQLNQQQQLQQLNQQQQQLQQQQQQSYQAMNGHMNGLLDAKMGLGSATFTTPMGSAPVTVSDRSLDVSANQQQRRLQGDHEGDDWSSVSSSDMP